jgi:hypothetical protein
MFIIARKISNNIKFLEFIAASFPNCVTSMSDESITFVANDDSSGFVDWYSFVADVADAARILVTFLEVAVVVGIFDCGCSLFCCRDGLTISEVIKILNLSQLLLIILHESRNFDDNGFNSMFEVFPPSLKTNKFVFKLFMAWFNFAALDVDEASEET